MIQDPALPTRPDYSKMRCSVQSVLTAIVEATVRVATVQRTAPSGTLAMATTAVESSITSECTPGHALVSIAPTEPNCNMHARMVSNSETLLEPM